jgi:hypothetical protein
MTGGEAHNSEHMLQELNFVCAELLTAQDNDTNGVIVISYCENSTWRQAVQRITRGLV